MIDRTFWEEVNKAWTKESKTSFIYTSGLGGEISPELKAFGGMFDEVETDGDSELDFGGSGGFGAGGAVLRGTGVGEKKPVDEKPKLDTERFMALVEGRSLLGFAEACDMLIECKLPANMEDVYNDLSDEMNTLQESITKFEGIYSTDMTEFYEYYIPETLELASTYMEYVDANVDEEIISDTEEEVMNSSKKLLIALVDKKNEIYKFGSMELKARAQALESLMSQDGHVNPEYRL